MLRSSGVLSAADVSSTVMDNTYNATAITEGEEKWGWKIRYRDYQVSTLYLESLRQEVDDLADNCLLALRDRGISIEDFLSQLGPHYRPADPVEYHNDERIQAFLEEVYRIPAYVDWQRLHHGQLTFLRNAGPAGFGLLYFSLIGGFSAPKIVKVLDATSYMTTQNCDATWRRLNETFEMVVDCIEDSECMKPGQNGWKSVLKVRFLHSRVRLGILSRGTWDAEALGLPINQEDMVGTLLSFSVNVLETIQRMTGRLTRVDEDAYLHLWRYIGYLIGIKEDYNPCTTLEVARGTTESIILHLLHPDKRSGEVARNVLRSVSGRKERIMNWSYAAHSEMARLLLGHPLADALGLETSLRHRAYVYWVFGMMYVVSNVLGPWMGERGVAGVKRALRKLVTTALDNTRSQGHIRGHVA